MWSCPCSRHPRGSSHSSRFKKSSNQYSAVLGRAARNPLRRVCMKIGFEFRCVILITFSSLRKWNYVEQLFPLVLAQMRRLGHLSGWDLGSGRMMWKSLPGTRRLKWGQPLALRCLLLRSARLTGWLQSILAFSFGVREPPNPRLCLLAVSFPVGPSRQTECASGSVLPLFESSEPDVVPSTQFSESVCWMLKA